MILPPVALTTLLLNYGNKKGRIVINKSLVHSAPEKFNKLAIMVL